MKGLCYKQLHLILLSLMVMAWPVMAAVHVQCPGDVDGDAVIDVPDPFHPSNACLHLGAGDGFSIMADGTEMYTFGFSNLTGVPPEMVMHHGMMAAQIPAPTIIVEEGNEFYLSLTNVGMMMRPDLFDPHTVHFHGFPQAAPIFDGMPGASIAINMGASLTYYYNIVEPGTYIYHCHVEATEHMQMGMLGNLYVNPAQNNLPDGTDLNGFTHHTGYTYAYNDGDGTSYYDVGFPLQLSGFDRIFHEKHIAVQPLPFAEMADTYSMINGRGYPDTLLPADDPSRPYQPVTSLIEAMVGQRILLRLSNLSTTDFFTIRVLGLPMKVIGKDARLLRGPTGVDLTYNTSSVTMGGGETNDVIIDTTGAGVGTYFLYTTNLNFLSNDAEDYGGIMTEIRLN